MSAYCDFSKIREILPDGSLVYHLTPWIKRAKAERQALKENKVVGKRKRRNQLEMHLALHEAQKEAQVLSIRKLRFRVELNKCFYLLATCKVCCF